MKKITAGLFTSVDGVVGEPQTWHFPFYCDELGAAVSAQLGAADTLLFGRVTYESFAGAWPAREEAGEVDAPMAKSLGDTRKIVVSRKPLAFTWRNSEQLRGDLVDAVRELKNEPGEGTIGMSGSVSVVRALLEAGLLDELHLFVHPVAVRRGLRLFDEAGTQTPLAPLACTAFKSGTVHLVYGPGDGGTVENQSAVAEKVSREFAD
ncbi:MAG TPA: dihydrofolate reductase family protein [Actinocrinis sp.]|jgi:dihydrofolate reductase